MKTLYILAFLSLIGIKAWAQCEPAALPYTENFESAETGTLPECASSTALTESTNTWTVADANGSKALQFSTATANTTDPLIKSMVSLRPVLLQAGYYYRVSFKYNSTNNPLGDAGHYIAIQLKNAETGTLTEITTITNTGSSVQTYLSDFVAVPQNGAYALVLTADSNPNIGELNIDDLSVAKIPCEVPTGLTVTAVTATSVSFSWEGENPGAYQYSVVPADEEPAFAFPTGIPSGTRINLLPETEYKVYVRRRCILSSDQHLTTYHWSDWSEGVGFTTTAAPVAGLNEVAGNHFSLYPNPAKDIVTFTGMGVIDTIEIYNTMGQLLLRTHPDNREASLPIQHLAAGVYSLIAYSGDWLNKMRLIKE